MDKNLNQLIDRLLIDTVHLRVRQSLLTEMTLNVFAHLLTEEEYKRLETGYSDALFSRTEEELKDIESLVSDIRLMAEEFLRNRELHRHSKD